MPQTYFVTALNTTKVRHKSSVVGKAEAISFDYSAWADDSGSVASVTWSTHVGDAEISGEALASNIASAVITTPNIGLSIIKIVATGTSDKDVQFIRILTRDPNIIAGNDYDFVGDL